MSAQGMTLMDDSNRYVSVCQGQLEVEEKVKNTSFHRNISHPECDYASTAESMSNRGEPGLNGVLYGFRLKTLCTLMVAAIVLSLLAAGLTVYAVVKYTDAAKELQIARENQGKVCLPCEDSAIQIDSWKVRNAAGDCCVRLEEVIAMTAKIAEERATEEVKKAQEKMIAKFSGLAGKGTGTPVLEERLSAHLVLDIDDKRKLIWSSSEAEFGHLSAGIHLTDNRTGEVHVSKPGYYFVYSQLGLNLDSDYYDKLKLVRHQIHVQKPGTRGKIFVENANMLWQGMADRSYSMQTSYTGGVVYLPSESRVRMELLNSDVLRNCKAQPCYKATLGMYRL